MNVSGGPDSASWKIRYDCDAGFELFGKADRECSDGEWERHDEEFVAHCATNVALSKPAEASSEVGAGTAAKAVDGRRSTVHEGSKVSIYLSLTFTNNCISVKWKVEQDLKDL